MGLFGKSLDEKVRDAVAAISQMGLDVERLGATVDGKVVTLTGLARTMDAKTRVMQELNARVECDNVINTIRVVEAPAKQAVAPVPAEAPPTPAEAAAERIHVVAPGDTLSGLAKRYYGKGSLYMKIFEANTDILKDPNLIKVGQKLRIPE